VWGPAEQLATASMAATAVPKVATSPKAT